MNSFYALTDYEKLLLNYNKCGDSIVMGTLLVENQNSRLELTEDKVKQALLILQKRHPFFRAYLKDSSNIQVQYEDYNPIELDWSDNSITRSELISQLEIFNSKFFDFKYKSNFVRCKVASFIDSTNVKMYSINLSLALIITDGINITTVTIELVNIINALLTNTECEEMKTVLEPVESLHHYVDKYSMFGESQKNMVEDLNKIEEPVFILPIEFRKYNETGFKLSLFKLDKELTNKILKKTKENKIRLSGYLNTAVYYALKELYDENNITFPSTITCGNPANMRIRFNPGIEFNALRMHVCITTIVLNQEEMSGFKNIWKDSDHIHNRLQSITNVENGSIFAMSHDIDSLKFLNELYDQSDDLKTAIFNLSKHNHSDLGLSNIGSYVWNKKMDIEGPLKIKESYFSDSLQSVPCVLPGLIFHIGFWDGQIMIQLSSNKYAIGSKFVDQYVSLLIKQFKSSVLE